MFLKTMTASVVALAITGAASAVTVDMTSGGDIGTGNVGSSVTSGDVTFNASKALSARAARRGKTATALDIVVGDDGTGIESGKRRDTSGINKGEVLEVAFNGATSSDSVSIDVANIDGGRRGDKAMVMVNVVGQSSPIVVSAASVKQAFNALGAASGSIALADLIGTGQQIESFIIKGVKGSFNVSGLSFDAPAAAAQAANPEPFTASLVLLGGAAIGFATRRRRQAETE